MKLVVILRGVAVTLACTGILFPPSLFAAGPQTRPSQRSQASGLPLIPDVALREGGGLIGQVLDPQGAPVQDVSVRLAHQGQTVAATRTSGDGRFYVRGLRGGVYSIETSGASGVYRLWAPRTAPPSAQAAALVIQDEATLVRGQGRVGSALQILSNPWVLGGLAAAAIAVPLAVDSS